MADSVWDYGVLGVQLLVTITLLALTTYALMVVDHLRSVMRRDTLMTSFITVSFLIWSWSALISNRHFSRLHELANWSCVLWDFWLQYALGLNLVFTLLIIRLNWHRLIQERKQAVQMKRQTLLLIFVCSLPTLLVCGGVEYNHGTTLNHHTCQAQAGWKYALTACLLLNYAGLLVLVVRGLRYRCTTRDHKELLYGTAVASAALLLILVLNLAHQTEQTYGRVLTGLAINFACVSLFYGLIGLPLLYSLRMENQYEIALRLTTTANNTEQELEGVAQLLVSNVAYGHYLNWLLQRYDYDNKELLTRKKAELPRLITPPGLREESDIMKEFCEYVAPSSQDPEDFLFQPYLMVKLLQKLDVMLYSERHPDSAWKRHIDNTFLVKTGKHYVMLPHKLQQELLHTFIDSKLDYSNLLLCTKLWLLTLLEQLTWSSYLQDRNTGLPAYVQSVSRPFVQQYVAESRLAEV